MPQRPWRWTASALRHVTWPDLHDKGEWMFDFDKGRDQNGSKGQGWLCMPCPDISEHLKRRCHTKTCTILSSSKTVKRILKIQNKKTSKVHECSKSWGNQWISRPFWFLVNPLRPWETHLKHCLYNGSCSSPNLCYFTVQALYWKGIAALPRLLLRSVGTKKCWNSTR